MKKSIVFALLVLTAATTAAQQSSQIRLNQIGFYPDAPKVAAIVDSPSDSFYVVTADGVDTVFTGALTGERMWSAAGERVRRAVFTNLQAEGEYLVAIPGLGTSYPFEIATRVHEDVARGAIKAYYFNRASTSLSPKYADRWFRAAGHPDNSVLVHPSAASVGRPAGTVISAPKGWYDAGDYNKYIVNSGISVGTLLMLYEHYPQYFADLDTNIPESDNDLPDLLDEVLWNIRWMLAMQDPEDGGVYHKLTTANFEGFVMPNKATQPRYVVRKGTSAALDFAAVMALGARIFDDFEAATPGLADSMLNAAGRAWDWAQANPETPYRQNALNQEFDPDISTGEYGDGSSWDEFRWAAAEMFVTTGRDSFLVMYPPYNEPTLAAPGWPSVGTMGFISLAHHASEVAAVVDTTEIRGRLIGLANKYLATKRESPYDMVMGNSGDFYWGSNSLAANEGMILMQAWRMTKDERYLEAALSNLDYLLGRNGTGYSFMTGFGDRTPMNPHHRQSGSDGIREPVPGFLAGGPNPGQQDGCTYPSSLPAKSYLDDTCSYASNEIAINWNAPLAYLAGALEATYSPDGKPVRMEESPLPGPGPNGFGLETFPNPTRSATQVRFTLAGPTSISVIAFDILGREVAEVVAARSLSAGQHEAAMDVSSFAPGVYFVHIQSPDAVQTHPVLVVR